MVALWYNHAKLTIIDLSNSPFKSWSIAQEQSIWTANQYKDRLVTINFRLFEQTYGVVYVSYRAWYFTVMRKLTFICYCEVKASIPCQNIEQWSQNVITESHTDIELRKELKNYLGHNKHCCPAQRVSVEFLSVLAFQWHKTQHLTQCDLICSIIFVGQAVDLHWNFQYAVPIWELDYSITSFLG